MSYQPIEISEANVQTFAAGAVEFCRTLTEPEQRLWEQIITRAGGNDARDGAPAPSDDRQVLCDRYAEMLTGVWEAGVIIAPRYSGDMPNDDATD